VAPVVSWSRGEGRSPHFAPAFAKAPAGRLRTALAVPILIVGLMMVSSCQGRVNAEPPQVPTPRPPYRVGAVTITTASVSLAGTVTTPEGPGPFPTVIIARGAGSADLDAALADGLTRRGIVVLRADGRGVGLSTGDAATASAEALADDIVAMATRAKEISGVDPTRIGVLGQGPGASLAALAATRSSSIRFVAAFSAGQDARAILSQVPVPVYAATGDPIHPDVLRDLAAWVTSRK